MVSKLNLMTEYILSHTFKEFYTLQVLPHWKTPFPKLVSINDRGELLRHKVTVAQ